ncbi:transmembrane protein 115 [Condylostylus longicornis]|uniref:transmembrane protein 115 n=1 Tax=Condylostylus longicornis TaxID=2530218 RepID=UPI00244DF348|nr:transmembrane protein 115 [Condylostylus longicornis]XP_055372173.1 transmembrane protein 115 [Condylostylus longicornis]
MSLSFQRNLPYLKQQTSALLSNTSPVITSICLVTVFGYFLSFFDSAITVLSVTPGYILPPSFWIWTAFTFCFIELHLFEVLVDIITVGLCGKLLEPLWGQLEMFKFFAITNLGVAICTSFYYLFVYMCTKNSELLFNVHIHGLAGYVAGVSVAVRQMMPDHLIAKTRLGKFTNRNVPLSVLLVSLIFWAVGLLEGTYPAMFCSGLIVSWIYLRFYQYHPNGRGDSSESFTFASFFPTVMQSVIGMLVNPLYLCCLKVGIVRPPAPSRSISASTLSSITVSMPGVDPHDIERRRQIALKALSERLKAADLKQNSLPKSYPPGGKHQHQHQHHHAGHSHGSGAGHSHGHHHSGHGHSHGGHGQHQHHMLHSGVSGLNPNIPTTVAPQFKPNMTLANQFAIPPAIPLPYEPLGKKSTVTNEKASETIIDLDESVTFPSNPK